MANMEKNIYLLFVCYVFVCMCMYRGERANQTKNRHVTFQGACEPAEKKYDNNK